MVGTESSPFSQVPFVYNFSSIADILITCKCYTCVYRIYITCFERGMFKSVQRIGHLLHVLNAQERHRGLHSILFAQAKNLSKPIPICGHFIRQTRRNSMRSLTHLITLLLLLLLELCPNVPQQLLVFIWSCTLRARFAEQFKKRLRLTHIYHDV